MSYLHCLASLLLYEGYIQARLFKSRLSLLMLLWGFHVHFTTRSFTWISSETDNRESLSNHHDDKNENVLKPIKV